ASFTEMLLHRPKQLIARPATARSDRLPIAVANRGPIVHRDRLRAGDHHGVRRHLFEPLLVIAAHRPPLDKLETDRPNADEQDHRERHDYGRASCKRTTLILKSAFRKPQ